MGISGDWYITATAVREFQQIQGFRAVDDGEQFDRAAVELENLCKSAVLKKDEPHRQIWQAKTKIGGKTTRLELTVSKADRDEGDAPQLVRVRNKGRRGHRPHN